MYADTCRYTLARSVKLQPSEMSDSVQREILYVVDFSLCDYIVLSSHFEPLLQKKNPSRSGKDDALAGKFLFWYT